MKDITTDRILDHIYFTGERLKSRELEKALTADVWDFETQDKARDMADLIDERTAYLQALVFRVKNKVPHAEPFEMVFRMQFRKWAAERMVIRYIITRGNHQ